MLTGEKAVAGNTLDNLPVGPILRQALEAVRARIAAEFCVDRIVLFGSVVRGTADAESDVDLLIVLEDHPDYRVRNRIAGLIFDVNLDYDTNLSALVVDRRAWEEGLFSVLPIHAFIEREGISL
jgi:predicted nucleotidyltransferase